MMKQLYAILVFFCMILSIGYAECPSCFGDNSPFASIPGSPPSDPNAYPALPAPDGAVMPDIMTSSFKMIGSLMAVEAEVDGRKGIFIIDSGAPTILLNNQHFDQGRIDPVQSRGITGGVQQVGTRYIKSFKWKDYELSNFQVKTLDLSHIERSKQTIILGLLGYAVYKKFELEIDYQLSQLKLYKLERDGTRSKGTRSGYSHEIPFKMATHLPVLKLEIAGQKLKFGIDTGAESNTIDNNIPAEVVEAHFQVSKRMRLMGTSGKKIEVLAGTFEGMEIAGYPCGNMQTLLTNMEDLNAVYQSDLDGMLGYEFLKQQKMALNFKEKKLYIWAKDDDPNE